jgi:hypothetical protein
VTIGVDGLPLISYYDNTNDDLKVSHCSDVACTSATITTLDSAGEVGQHTSITIGADGLGLISYYDFTNGDLKAAHCEDVACTSATVSTIDGDSLPAGFNVGQHVGDDWRGWAGAISYFKIFPGLRVALLNVQCTVAQPIIATAVRSWVSTRRSRLG